MKLLPLAVVLIIAGVWGYKLFALSGSVESYAKYWDNRAQERGEILYVALGDSAAQGIGASQPGKGYVGLIASSLQDSTSKSVRVVNISQSGAKTGDVIDSQLSKLTSLKPDYVTLAIGGNDIKEFDETKFRKNVSTIMAGLPPGTYVADAPYFMHGVWEKNAAKAANIIEQAAQANGMVAVPLHHSGMKAGWQGMFLNFSADWFHPNDRGHRLWAETFLNEMNN